MPYYSCKLINEKGEIVLRKIHAKNRKSVSELITQKDEKLISVGRDLSSLLSTSIQFRSKIKDADFLVFNQKLIIMLKSGTSFIKALEVIISEMNDGFFKSTLAKIERDIKNGISISDAFNAPQFPFLKIYKASLLAGEKSGNLIPILEKFNEYVEKITMIRRKTISSLSYPIVLFVFMVAMVFIVMSFVIPSFSRFYQSFQSQLPPITLFFIKISKFFEKNIFILVLGTLSIYILAKLIEKITGSIIIDRLKIKTPLVGDIIIKNSLAVFSRTLSILISGGIPIPESTVYAIDIFTNKYISREFEKIPEKIRDGALLSETIKEIKIVPPVMKEVIQVGDSSGNLSDILDKTSEYFEASIDTKINRFISLIEPIMIVVIGSVVTFMLISIYLPIFNSMRVIQ